MAWYSGLFGGGEEEQQQAAPQKGFFARMFGGIGDFIGSLVKMAVIAVAAITGLGLIFRNDSARNAIDKFTGGEGKGAGTWISNMFEGGLGKVKEFFNITPTPENIAKPTTVGANKIPALIPDGERILEDKIVKDYRSREILTDFKKAESDIDKQILTREERQAELVKIEKLRKGSFALGAMFEALDQSGYNFIAANKDKHFIQPFKTGLASKLPTIPEDLETFAIEKIGNDRWNKLTEIGKREALGNAVYAAVGEKPDLTKRSLKEDIGIFTAHEIILPSKVPTDKTFDPIIQTTGLADTEFGTKHLPGKELEIIYRQKINEALESGKLDEALKYSTTIQSRFQNTAETLSAMLNHKATAKVGEKEKPIIESEMVLYRGAVKDFDDLNKYIVSLKRREQYDTLVGNPTHAAISYTARDFPSSLDTYTKGIKQLEAGTTASAIDSNPEQKTVSKITSDNKEVLAAALDRGLSKVENSKNEPIAVAKATLPFKKPDERIIG